LVSILYFVAILPGRRGTISLPNFPPLTRRSSLFFLLSTSNKKRQHHKPDIHLSKQQPTHAKNESKQNNGEEREKKSTKRYSETRARSSGEKEGSAGATKVKFRGRDIECAITVDVSLGKDARWERGSKRRCPKERKTSDVQGWESEGSRDEYRAVIDG